VATQLTDDMNRVVAVHHLRVARDQHAHMQMRHGAGQGGGHVAQAAGFHQISKFGGHKQDFFRLGL
jgi:hypothetical protein